MKRPITRTHAQPRSDKPSFSFSRRRLLAALPALAIAPQLLAQSMRESIAVRKLHSFGLRVGNLERSLSFYQDLFGAPIQARQGDTVCLRIGPGPRYFSLTQAGPGEAPGYTHIGLSVADFDARRIQSQLTALGVPAGNEPAAGSPPLDHARRSWLRTRTTATGTTRELFFTDIEGLTFQLVPETYCGGAGEWGSVCENVEMAPGEGMFELVDLSHFTNFVTNGERANTFYTQAFGLGFQAYQGPQSPIIGVGDGIQFLMYVGAIPPGTPSGPGFIHHACFSVSDFRVDPIRERLTGYGLTAIDGGGNPPPLSHWVSLRMPNRGGTEGGTPELYFSDPDGIRVQLQDPGYCGGGGYLGDSCPSI